MFRRLALLGVVLLLAVAARPASGDARMQEIMRTKLSNTQALLKAIVTNDYKEIDRAATALSRISEMEIVSWQNPPKREYTDQAMLFMSAVDDLRDASRRRDIEAVGAAYSTLITTCVHCHAYVRDARIASLMTLRPRTLRYDWFLTSDGTECEVHEAYIGAEGLIEHNSHILEARTKLFRDYADNHFMTVYGEASQPLLDLFKAHGVGFKWFYFVQGLQTAAATPSPIPVPADAISQPV